MCAWDHQILILIGTLECEALNIVLSCGECGKRVALDFCTGAPTAMRRQLRPVQRFLSILTMLCRDWKKQKL